MKYQILDDAGNVINTIIATLEFVEQHYPNRYQQVVEPVAPQSQEWRIYTGPFRDRFDTVVGPGTKVSIMASTNPVIQAIISDMSDRKWIDLKSRKSELTAALNIIKNTVITNIVSGQPVLITDQHIDAILNTVPSDDEKYLGPL